MAIAFDSSSVSGSFAAGSTLTIAHTIVGTATVGLAFMTINSGSDVVTSVTLNGVTMTRAKWQLDNASAFGQFVYWVANPATGNVVWNLSDSGSDRAGGNTAYTGASSSALDATAGQNSGGSASTSYTNTLTTVANNSWHVASLRQTVGGGMTAGTNTSTRLDGIGGGTYNVVEDTDGAVTPAGSNVLTATGSSTNTWFSAGVSIAPASTTAIKTVDGLAKASVKTYKGLAIASVKTFNGLA